MDMKATYDDVNLILRLYELRREEKLRKAREWFSAHFHAKTLDEVNTLGPQGSEENAYYRMVVTHWEMVASFVTSGVLNEKLFFQSGREMLFVWERVREIVPALREAYKDPTALRNLEAVSKSFIQWLNSEQPGAYEMFSKRVRGEA